MKKIIASIIVVTFMLSSVTIWAEQAKGTTEKKTLGGETYKVGVGPTAFMMFNPSKNVGFGMGAAVEVEGDPAQLTKNSGDAYMQIIGLIASFIPGMRAEVKIGWAPIAMVSSTVENYYKNRPQYTDMKYSASLGFCGEFGFRWLAPFLNFKFPFGTIGLYPAATFLFDGLFGEIKAEGKNNGIAFTSSKTEWSTFGADIMVGAGAQYGLADTIFVNGGLRVGLMSGTVMPQAGILFKF